MLPTPFAPPLTMAVAPLLTLTLMLVETVTFPAVLILPPVMLPVALIPSPVAQTFEELLLVHVPYTPAGPTPNPLPLAAAELIALLAV